MYTSGFADDVTFSHNICCVMCLAATGKIDVTVATTASIPAIILLSGKDQQVHFIGRSLLSAIALFVACTERHEASPQSVASP